MSQIKNKINPQELQSKKAHNNVIPYLAFIPVSQAGLPLDSFDSTHKLHRGPILPTQIVGYLPTIFSIKRIQEKIPISSRSSEYLTQFETKRLNFFLKKKLTFASLTGESFFFW